MTQEQFLQVIENITGVVLTVKQEMQILKALKTLQS